jgi:ABC-2 type transport system ATP-binding protein
VGAAAHSGGVELHQLASRGVGLEEIFLRLTGGDR